MPKASLTLPTGTIVTIDGTIEDVQRLIALYGETPASKAKVPRRRTSPRPTRATTDSGGSEQTVDLMEIVNLIKTCPEAERIETTVLDRPDRLSRTLLPLYVVFEYLANKVGLTSGDINKVTTDLGIPVATSNASTTLSSAGTRFVIGDKVRRKGVAVRYKLSRRGVQHMKTLLADSAPTAAGEAAPGSR
jgi:hypothetical protein